MHFSVSFMILPAQRARQVHVVGQECRSPGHQFAVTNKFCAVTPNICRASVWNLFCVTLLAPVIMRRHLGY
jgi:hypothetical protein